MPFRSYFQAVVTLVFLTGTGLTLPVNAQSAAITEPVAPPSSVVAQRYSDTAAEIFWARPATFGLHYEISRDGALLSNTDGVSYYDPSLSANSAPTYSIVAIDRQGNRSLPSTVTVPTRDTGSETLAPPANVTARRYSDSAAEIFWSRSPSFGLRYEVSRDGTLLNTISGISYYDSALAANSSPTYTIIAIDRQGRRSSPSSITVPTHNASSDTLAAPAGVVGQRYSGTAAEIFWDRPATFGLSYEISRDGTLLGNTDGVSYYDDTLNQGEAATFTIVAIDRQGRRSAASSVTIPASNTTEPEQPLEALINLDSYEQILRELVDLINANPLYDTLYTQPDVDDDGITFVSISTDPVEDEEYGLGFVSDYSCDAGGSIEDFNFPEPGSRKYTFDDCALETGTFNGVLKEFYTGREGTGVTATNFSVESAEQTRLLSGTQGSSIYRGVPGLYRYWDTSSLDMSSNEGSLLVSDYELTATSVYRPDSNTYDSQLAVSFDVTAPWTENQNVHVEVSLEASIEAGNDFSWQSGNVVAVADDGSELTVTPADATQRTFDVELLGQDGAITRQWSDDFEIFCAYRDIDSCGNF